MASLLNPGSASLSLSDANRVKVVILGEAGVGKTTFTQAIKGKAVKNPLWTVGCSVEVLIHSYCAGTPNEAPYFVELWDIGGSRSHRNSRKVFYQPTHGLILVHDLANRKTEENLRQWLNEVFRSENQTATPLYSPYGPMSSPARMRLPTTVFDSEQFDHDIPILIVGTKADLLSSSPNPSQTAPSASNRTPPRSATKLATDCNADEVSLDCRSAISPGSTVGLKLSRFFDKVVDCQHNKTRQFYRSSPASRRKNV